jgi:hypothetical protein
MSDLQDVIATNAIRAYNQGLERGEAFERDRIIKLARNRVCFDHANGCDHASCYALCDLIELIKKEEK